MGNRSFPKRALLMYMYIRGGPSKAIAFNPSRSSAQTQGEPVNMRGFGAEWRMGVDMC